MKFIGFPKIPRLKRGMVITEKIDGTNAQVAIVANTGPDVPSALYATADLGEYLVFAGSRKRWIQPGNDNYGFAQWVHQNAPKLVLTLGEGIHFGEWWGQGIQRRYDATMKVFSLFNSSRWGFLSGDRAAPECEYAPDALQVVPTLYTGDFCTEQIDEVLTGLRTGGSVAAPGFMEPEGIVVFHSQSRSVYKVTLDDDDAHKGV